MLGAAVESAGCWNDPDCSSSFGWYQFPDPPRPMCAYSDGWLVFAGGAASEVRERLASRSW